MEYYNTFNNIYKTALSSNVIYPLIKVELMDYEENVLQEIQQSISTQNSGSISVNYQQGVRRSCSITLVDETGEFLPDINKKIWINTKFKIYTGIRVPYYITPSNIIYIVGENGEYIVSETTTQDLVAEASQSSNETIPELHEDIYWFSQGVYVITNPQCMRSTNGKTITLNGVDKFGLFGSETNFRETEGTYLIPQGTQVKNLIKSILESDMGNGKMIDSTPPIIDPEIGSQVLPTDIEKSPNQYFSEILIEIANMFSCDIYYDVEGHLTLKKGNTDATMEEYGALWDYVDVLPDYGDVNNSYDFASVYNVIKVVGNNPDYPSYQAIIRNELSSSPTSVQAIGEKIKYVEATFCFDQTTTNDFATYLLRKHSIVQQALDFSSTFMPHLEVNNIITITDSYFDYVQQRFVIQSLNIPLSATQPMTVTASNTANIPYYEY